jgi:hypothetical protein
MEHTTTRAAASARRRALLDGDERVGAEGALELVARLGEQLLAVRDDQHGPAREARELGEDHRLARARGEAHQHAPHPAAPRGEHRLDGLALVGRRAHRGAAQPRAALGRRLPGAGPNARLSELHAAWGCSRWRSSTRCCPAAGSLAGAIRDAVALAWQGAQRDRRSTTRPWASCCPTPATGPYAGDRRAARDALVAALRESGVEAGILSYALHRLPQFAALGVNNVRRFPVADAVVDGGVAVPLHPGMSEEDAGVVIDAAQATRGVGDRRPYGAA